jgi:hypothetical protein
LAIPSHSKIGCSIVCFSFCQKSRKEGDTNTQQLENIRLAKEIGFDLGALTFSPKNKCPVNEASVWTFI